MYIIVVHITSDVLYKFGIQEWEAHKFCLIQVHHEQFIGWGQICLLWGELFVEIADVFTMFLKIKTKRY